MAFRDVKVEGEQHKYDWDNLNVGNTHLDHSQNFFSKKHYEHERFNEIDIFQQKIVKNNVHNSPENKNIADDQELVTISCISTTFHANNDKTPTSSVIEDNSADKEQCHKVNTNLATEWSTKKPLCVKTITSKGAILKTVPPPPHAYLMKDHYKKNREKAESRRAEEERKLREFHSRPVPIFYQRQPMQSRNQEHVLTVPVTPQVLRKSQEIADTRRKWLEEYNRKNQPPKFESRPPTVLKEKPFVPKKSPLILQQCPFKLQMEERLKERKQYDETTKKTMEEKQKQRDEERKRVEDLHIRELRKATTFKARPNPFKTKESLK